MQTQTAIPTNKTRDDTIAQAITSLSDNLVRFTGAIRVLSMQVELLRQESAEQLDAQERATAATNRLESVLNAVGEILEREAYNADGDNGLDPVPEGAGQALELLYDEDDDFLYGAEITQSKRLQEEEPLTVEPVSVTRERIEQQELGFEELSQ